MRINKYFPISFIYFFLNSVGLPFGLTYTALLSPFLYLWVLLTRKREVLWPYLLALTPFVFAHIVMGVDTKSYLVSFFNLTAVYIFCQAFYTFLKKCGNIYNIFKTLLIINFILCLVAIPFYFTPYYELFWIKQLLTEGVNNFLRLKMFTYEASYYATLFTPLFFFFFTQILLRQNKIGVWKLVPMLLLPYLLSFSMGVITCVLLSTFITYLFYFNTLSTKRRVINLLSVVGLLSFFALVFILVFFPENALFQRIGNIVTGNDISGKGRTSDAFYLAGQILEKKSYVWGIGLGQLKIIGADIIRTYYHYEPDFNIIAIPNATAETLVVFGALGLVIRIGLEIFLFIYTRVWTNYYRLFLFLFIFIFQFTGSFITNIAEYVIWILAFTNTFPSFNIKVAKKFKHSSKQLTLS